MGSVEIDATPQEIMAVITDFEAYPEWADGVKETEVLKADGRGRGQEVRFAVSSLGLSDDILFRYTYAAASTGCSWTLVEARNVKALEGSYELAGTGPTEVTYHLTLEPSIPLPGIVKRQIEKRMLKAALHGLKRRVEGG